MKKKRKPIKQAPRTVLSSMSPKRDTPEKTNDLELRSAAVLRGATDLANRLMIAMAVGTPSVSELAYAVKVRVKEDYKIVEKVLKKRNPSDPDYDVARLRDIVGVRIVTLYRLDALRIIPLILQKIASETEGPSSLFIPDSVEELIIYTNNPDGDAQGLAGRIIEIFDAYKLKDKVKLDSTPTNYTSIHMVAWGRGKYRDGYKDIPIEIQVRTALEDVWGEIDHSLKYKRKSLGSPHMPGKRRLDGVLSHLNVMKTLIDGTAQYADQIKIQLDELDQDSLVSASTRQAEDAMALLNPLHDLPGNVRQVMETAISHERKAFGQLSKSSREDDLLALSNLHSARDYLEEALQALKTATPISDSSRTQATYVAEMEKALVLYELGKKVESGANLLAEAATIYRRYEQTHPKRALVKYRLATVLDALGDRSSAKSKFQQTLHLMANNDAELPEGHWIRSATPRYLGTMVWEEAYQLAKRSLGSNQQAIRAQRLKLYLEAYAITRPAYDIDLDPDIPFGGEPVSMERERVVNNLLFYAVEYLELGGEVESLRKVGFRDGDLHILMQDGGGRNWKKIDDVDYLDTLRRAYSFLGDSRTATGIAKRIVSKMAMYRQHGLVMSKHQADILEEAEVALLNGKGGTARGREVRGSGGSRRHR
jgi:ppGpp synthetase/RelA/SpoT-type nucleotidyltranferase